MLWAFLKAEKAKRGNPFSLGIKGPQPTEYWRPAGKAGISLTREWSAEELQLAMALNGLDWNQFFIPRSGISDVKVVEMVLSQTGSPVDLAEHLDQLSGEGRMSILRQVRRLEHQEIVGLRSQNHVLLNVWTEIWKTF